jgi:glycosyltransferase involved in cell wall biosynthesis
MNVGVFLHDYPPEAGGGHTFQTDVFKALVEFAAESRHSFTVFSKRAENLRGVPQTDRFRVVPVPEKASPTTSQSPAAIAAQAVSSPRSLARRAVAKALRRPASRPAPQQPSIGLEEVFKEAGVDFIWYLSASGFPIDIPYLVVVWDLQHRLQPWFPEVSERGEWDLREAFYTRLLQRASVIITGTSAGRKEVQHFYRIPENRIKILPHPTPQSLFDNPPDDGAAILRKYGVPEGYLFYPAQFWAHKNHVNLLLAVRELRETHDLSFPVVFVGADKGNQAHIRQVVNELGLTAQVHFLGFVPREDLAALYLNAFALTYMTFFGPENLPPLEAFALGCPVIASNVPGAEEQLGDAALLVSPQDPHGIALAIKALHDDPKLRQTLIKAGAERASAWTGRDFVRGVFSILDEFESIRRSWGCPVT